MNSVFIGGVFGASIGLIKHVISSEIERSRQQKLKNVSLEDHKDLEQIMNLSETNLVFLMQECMKSKSPTFANAHEHLRTCANNLDRLSSLYGAMVSDEDSTPKDYFHAVARTRCEIALASLRTATSTLYENSSLVPQIDLHNITRAREVIEKEAYELLDIIQTKSMAAPK